MAGQHDEQILETLVASCRALVALHGDPGSDAVADVVIRRYHDLTPKGRARFFSFCASELGPDHQAVRSAIDSYLADPNDSGVVRLRNATMTPRMSLFDTLNNATAGLSALLQMRADLANAARGAPDLQPVDADLLRLFQLWFNRGFLELRSLDWSTPARTLEKLIEYEAVHEITGWDDLRRRLDAADRRIFAYFHPALPDDPVIFVEVALTRGLASSIQQLLAPRQGQPESDRFDTAIFYSITNCQSGLRGVTFGNALIKQVTSVLAGEVPELTTFSTLSPIPGFRRWLDDRRSSRDAGLSTADRAKLAHLDEPGWLGDARHVRRVRPVLERACARYLLAARPDGMPADPVARFHLRNGARVERINWAGDTSERGIAQSAGMLVNYLYDPDSIETNRQRLELEGHIAHSPLVADLAALQRS